MSSRPLRGHRVSADETARRHALVDALSGRLGPRFVLAHHEGLPSHGLTFGTGEQSSRAVVYDDGGEIREVHTLTERADAAFLTGVCRSRLDHRARLHPSADEGGLVVDEEPVETTTYDVSPYGWVMSSSRMTDRFAVVVGSGPRPRLIRLTLAQ